MRLTAEWEEYLQFREAFEQVLDPRLYPMAWLDAQVWSGLMKVWAEDDACLLTAIKPYPTGHFEVHVMIAAGNLATLTGPLIADVERWAADRGALFVTIASRPGWARLMKRQGYEMHQTEVRKEV